ncbi:cytochrome P450 [Calothrix sp. NIES-4071]|nr:cytochrome P450 [Calothrix sp. NIES-4071]BAZ57019.1 cytochrome P450 [Calothrix sp. NIES-4105]
MYWVSHLACNLMKLILATMLLNYQFKLEEVASVAPTRRGFLISPQGGVMQESWCGYC